MKIFCTFSECDINGDILWTWSYPNVSEEERNFFIKKSQFTLAADGFVPFWYSQWKKSWYYIYTCETTDSDNLPKVGDNSQV